MPDFIPDLSVILAFAVATFVIAITPGPDMALQMSRSINYGFRHGIACGLGAMSGIVVHTTLVAFGISVLIIAAPPLFWALKIAGAVYLLWLAWQAITKGGGIRLAGAQQQAARPLAELSHRRRDQPAQPQGRAVLRDLPAPVRRCARSRGGAEAVLPRRRVHRHLDPADDR